MYNNACASARITHACEALCQSIWRIRRSKLKRSESTVFSCVVARSRECQASSQMPNAFTNAKRPRKRQASPQTPHSSANANRASKCEATLQMPSGPANTRGSGKCQTPSQMRSGSANAECPNKCHQRHKKRHLRKLGKPSPSPTPPA